MISSLCKDFNISESLKLVSGELEILGYPEVHYEYGNDKTTLVDLINITWTLISDLKRLSQKENERTVKFAKLKSQMKMQDEEKQKLQKLLNQERNAYLAAKESLEHALSLKKVLETKLREGKMEIKNLKKSIDFQNLHHGNEILGKENTIANLKFKLNKFVNNDCSTDKEESFVQPHFLHLAKNPKLKEYVNSLTNNIQMLILENANFRNLILKVIIVLSDKFNSKITVEKISSHLLNLPGEDLIVKLEQEFENILNYFEI